MALAGKIAGKARNKPPTVGPNSRAIHPAATVTVPPKTKRKTYSYHRVARRVELSIVAVILTYLRSRNQIKEGAEVLQEEGEKTVLDLGLIGAGSRVERYEMAGYLTAILLAKRIGSAEAVSLLSQSLAEEENAEKTLRKIASLLMKSAPKESLAAATQPRGGG